MTYSRNARRRNLRKGKSTSDAALIRSRKAVSYGRFWLFTEPARRTEDVVDKSVSE